MPSFNQSAIGQVVRVNFNQLINTGTGFTIEFEPEKGEGFTKTATLGTADIFVDDSKYLANEYIEYTIEAEDFSEFTGKWRKKGVAVLPSETLAPDYSFFRVMP